MGLLLWRSGDFHPIAMRLAVAGGDRQRQYLQAGLRLAGGRRRTFLCPVFLGPIFLGKGAARKRAGGQQQRGDDSGG